MRDEMRRREIEEAAAAGEKALYKSGECQRKASGSKELGNFRYAGRRFFTDWVKHSKNVRRHRLYGRGKETIACIPEGA